MEIQLTKTKTLTLGGEPKGLSFVDVCGIDLTSGEALGAPAVRLVKRKGVIHLAAVGFVPPPSAPLPTSWEAAAKSCSWSLPSPFQSPVAALAVSAANATFSQTTRDAFAFDIAPGVPVSHGGIRHVMKPLAASAGFVMEASLPEYQVLWLSRLLPEGYRPTAASIQVRHAALAACLHNTPAFIADGGTAVVLFASPAEFSVAGYKGGELVLWRNCRELAGWRELSAALERRLGLGENMAACVLSDTLIDPRPALEPLLAPLLNELGASRDYLVGTLGAAPARILALGIPPDDRYFGALVEERLKLPLCSVNPLDGLKLDIDLSAVPGAAGSEAFAAALGAALALMGEERVA